MFAKLSCYRLPATSSPLPSKTLPLAAAFLLAAVTLFAQPSDRIPGGLRARAARGERFPVIVQLNTEVDAAPGMLNQLRTAAISRVQERVLLRTPGLGRTKRLQHFPFVAIEADAQTLAQLESDPDVVSVQADELRHQSLTTSVPLIGAPTAWSLGASGKGWSIAILDTGVDKSHPFLAGKVVSEACYSSDFPGFAESTCTGGDGAANNSGSPCSASVSGCDHGTHVAGIAAGHMGSLSGVAQDATLIAIKVFSIIHSADFCYPGPSPCVGAYDSDILAGLDRVYALRTQFDIAAANLSLGGGMYSGTCDASFPAYKSAIDLLRGVGIATVIPSGNEGATRRIGAPACISTAISVAATTKSDRIASYSNRSSALKLLAPGSSIYSSVPGGGFATFDGTSMAAPHVAGAWAVMRSRQPTASVTDILNALTTTGLGIVDPATGVTRRRIKLDAAVKSVPAGAPLITSLTANPAPPQPANAPITWTARAVGGVGALEYKFWLYSGQTASWTMLQEYSTSKSVTWTPSAIGAYNLQVWVRTVGSSASYQTWKASSAFSIIDAPVAVTSFTADRSSPLFPAVPTMWTVGARGGSGPLEYKFWRHDLETQAWTVVQDYSPANTFTWTPGPNERGRYQFQVWVRSAGSAEAYEAAKNSSAFALLGTTYFIFNSEPNDYIGQSQRTIHGAFDGSATLRLEPLNQSSLWGGEGINTSFVGEGFWYYWYLDFGAKAGSTLSPGVYEQATRYPFNTSGPGLSVRGDGRGCNEVVGRFVIVDLARNTSNEITRFAADFEQHCEGLPPALRGSVRYNSLVPPSDGPVAIKSFAANVALPPALGSPVTWTAVATGGGPPLRYRFWMHSSSTGAWSLLQDGPSKTFTWTPAQAATYTLQVWVKSANSMAAYEASAGTPIFTVSAVPVQVTALAANVPSPIRSSTPVTWTATASGGNGSLEYQFWRYNNTTHTWTVVQGYGPQNTYTWQPAPGDVGSYGLQVWVRSVGSSASWEAWRSSGTFDVIP